MSTSAYRVYGYRWVVLGAFMLANLAVQMLWIAYAPVTELASRYYGVSELQIGLLSMTFMIVFIPLSIPTAWVLDTFGFRIPVSLAAVLMAAAAILRGVAGNQFSLVLTGTVGIAIAQPFLMNAWTKVPAHWFPLNERTTAVGLIVLSNLAGTAVGLGLTPALASRFDLPKVQLIYGAIAGFSALAFVLFAREHPATPPCPPEMQERALMFDGLKHALTIRPFWIYLLVWFIGMGVFNGVTTWIDGIVSPRGFSGSRAGQAGALMLVGGILGALIIPSLSDRHHKRQRYLFLSALLTIPGLLGLAFAGSYSLLALSAFILGFFLVSSGPIGMQYAAEVTWPTPEGTSAGLIQLCGQASVVFVYAMSATRSSNGSFTRPLIIATALMAVGTLAITRLKDSYAIHSSRQVAAVEGSQTLAE